MDTINGLTIIVAAAAVVASSVAAIYTGWQAAAAHTSVELTKQIHRDQGQPYVFADIRSDAHQPQMVVLMVRNEGPTVARGVAVRLDPPLVLPGRDTPPISEWTISALTPGAQLVRALDSGARFFNEGPTRGRHRVTVTALGPNGRTEPLAYEIDLQELARVASGHNTVHDVAEALHEISKHVEEIADHVARER